MDADPLQPSIESVPASGFDLSFNQRGPLALTLAQRKPAFSDFHDFVCQTLGLAESTPGWRRMLLDEHRGDERRAFDAFFELLRQFRRGDA